MHRYKLDYWKAGASAKFTKKLLSFKLKTGSKWPPLMAIWGLSWVYCLKMVNEFFFWQKTGPFLDLFVQNLAIFAQKSCFLTLVSFSDIFFETAHQICLKLGQKMGAITLNHRMAVLCLGNTCFGRFCHFWVKNTLHVVLGCFWSFSSKPLMFLVNFCYLN